MKRIAGPVALLICLGLGSAVGRDSLNFYLPDTEPTPEAKEEKAPAPKETPAKPKTQPAPEKKAEPKTETKPKEQPITKTNSEKAGSGGKKAPAAAVDLRIRMRKPTKPLDPPLDPYGIAKAFENRWDFSSFVISAQEELKFRLDAARARTLRLARAFSALSEEVETRQRNLNSAALAAYLLAQDQHTWVPVEGRNLTEAQMLAVRVTMQQDIAAMNSALHNYEVLRNSLNASAEEVAALEKNGLEAVQDEKPVPDNRITVPTASVAASQTQSALEERLLPLDALKAALAAEAMRDTAEQRQSIASFAPPPPMGRAPLPRTKVDLPAVPSEEVMKHQPKGESVPVPEKTALIFETPVNAPVHAVKDGVVVYAGPFRGYGDTVIIEHEKGLFSVYSHLGNVQVLERQPVQAGATLGRAGIPPELGRSGIHFQVRQGKTPIKPEVWLKRDDVQRLLTVR